jgi:hypothetical protein
MSDSEREPGLPFFILRTWNVRSSSIGRLLHARSVRFGLRQAQTYAQEVWGNQLVFVFMPPLMAVRIPCSRAVGVGGQPGTATSTGMTLATLPQLA